MNNKLLKSILVLVVLLTSEYVFSQVPPPNRTPPPGLPIDGSLFTLVAVAFGYGINKLKNKK